MNNRDVQIAWDYHDGTKHPGGRLLNPSHRYGPHQRPGLFKIYPDLQPIPLPQETGPADDEPRVTALQAIVGGDGPASGDVDLDLPSLARLLHYSAGITKHIHNLPFRAAACTGALYHIEPVLVNGDLPGLEAGVYHYDPGNSALRRLRQGDYRQVLIEVLRPGAGSEARSGCAGLHRRLQAQRGQVPGPGIPPRLLGQRHDPGEQLRPVLLAGITGEPGFGICGPGDRTLAGPGPG